MARNFFTLENGAIKTPLGEIKSLGIYCPSCDTFVGHKSECPNCGTKKELWRETKEPIHGVFTQTGGFPFKIKFLPFQSPEKLKEIFDIKKNFIDDRGQIFDISSLIILLSYCEMEDNYRKVIPSEKDININAFIPMPTDFMGDGSTSNK